MRRQFETASGVVLVTGSSGFIGFAVARRFGERWKTIGFDQAGPPHPPPTADCVSVDLRPRGTSARR